MYSRCSSEVYAVKQSINDIASFWLVFLLAFLFVLLLRFGLEVLESPFKFMSFSMESLVLWDCVRNSVERMSLETFFSILSDKSTNGSYLLLLWNNHQHVLLKKIEVNEANEEEEEKLFTCVHMCDKLILISKCQKKSVLLIYLFVWMKNKNEFQRRRRNLDTNLVDDSTNDKVQSWKSVRCRFDESFIVDWLLKIERSLRRCVFDFTIIPWSGIFTGWVLLAV